MVRRNDRFWRKKKHEVGKRQLTVLPNWDIMMRDNDSLCRSKTHRKEQSFKYFAQGLKIIGHYGSRISLPSLIHITPSACTLLRILSHPVSPSNNLFLEICNETIDTRHFLITIPKLTTVPFIVWL